MLLNCLFQHDECHLFLSSRTFVRCDQKHDGRPQTVMYGFGMWASNSRLKREKKKKGERSKLCCQKAVDETTDPTVSAATLRVWAELEKLHKLQRVSSERRPCRDSDGREERIIWHEVRYWNKPRGIGAVPRPESDGGRADMPVMQIEDEKTLAHAQSDAMLLRPWGSSQGEREFYSLLKCVVPVVRPVHANKIWKWK